MPAASTALLRATTRFCCVATTRHCRPNAPRFCPETSAAPAKTSRGFGRTTSKSTRPLLYLRTHERDRREEPRKTLYKRTLIKRGYEASYFQARYGRAMLSIYVQRIFVYIDSSLPWWVFVVHQPDTHVPGYQPDIDYGHWWSCDCARWFPALACCPSFYVLAIPHTKIA